MKEQFSEWSRRLRASDQQACSELFEALHRPLLRYANQFLTDEDAAYDMVQDAFIKVWTTRQDLNPDKSLKAFMYTIVRNRSLNHLRQLKTHESKVAAMPSPEYSAQPDPDELLDAEDLRTRLLEWIGELPPKRREAFQLSRFDGLSHEEIAAVMNVAPRTVTNHIMLALQHLRDRLNTFQTSGA